MNRGLVILLLLILAEGLLAQSGPTIFSSRDGQVRFLSEAPLERIEAASTTLQGAINVEEKKFAFLIDIPSFLGFNSELQREHFNENYLESDDYPKAYFSGIFIEDIDLQAIGEYPIRAKGDLFIHGKKQERIIDGLLRISKDSIDVEAYFTVLLSDHDINIPRIVTQKISSEIQIWVAAALMLKE